ncbi:MAG TPA: hypothetical protein VMW43_09200 [Bacteroidota bacterium]|nr:hypothetical protein [Bacteroidota bacterium]
MKANLLAVALLVQVLTLPAGARQVSTLTNARQLTHFRLTYDRTISDDDAGRIAKSLERGFEVIHKRLAFAPSRKIPVSLFSSVEKVRSVLRYKVFDDAYFDDGRIILILPGLQEEGRVLDPAIDRVVARAFTAEIVRCPPWVAEVYSIAAGYDLARCGSPTRTTIANFSDLGEDLSRADSPDAIRATFANLGATAKFLVERYGDAKMDALIAQFRAARPVEEAFENAFGEKYSLIEKDWANYIRSNVRE